MLAIQKQRFHDSQYKITVSKSKHKCQTKLEVERKDLRTFCYSLTNSGWKPKNHFSAVKEWRDAFF